VGKYISKVLTIKKAKVLWPSQLHMFSVMT